MIQAISIYMAVAGVLLATGFMMYAIVRLKPADKAKEDEEQMQYLAHWKKDRKGENAS